MSEPRRPHADTAEPTWKACRSGADPSCRWSARWPTDVRDVPCVAVACSTVVVQQIVTILGVLAGAGASFAATSLIERSKWKRAHAVRWDERRLNAYVAYANAVKRMNHLSLRLAATSVDGALKLTL
jgi:hypothetical protein